MQEQDGRYVTVPNVAKYDGSDMFKWGKVGFTSAHSIKPSDMSNWQSITTLLAIVLRHLEYLNLHMAADLLRVILTG